MSDCYLDHNDNKPPISSWILMRVIPECLSEQ